MEKCSSLIRGLSLCQDIFLAKYKFFHIQKSKYSVSNLITHKLNIWEHWKSWNLWLYSNITQQVTLILAKHKNISLSPKRDLFTCFNQSIIKKFTESITSVSTVCQCTKLEEVCCWRSSFRCVLWSIQNRFLVGVQGLFDGGGEWCGWRL